MDAEWFWRHSKYYVQLLIFFLALSFEFAESFDYKNNQMAAIILVPGVAGTKIEAKYHTHGHPRGCDEDSDWELIWINLKAAAGGLPLRCWVYRYRLFYDRTAHRCRNQNGVETRVVGRFGSLKPVDYLTKDPFSRIGTNYFNDMSDALKDSGYSTDINLKAAGYDGRYAPIQQEEFGYFDRFTELVEKVATDSKRKVSIVSHSMGGLVAAYFLGLKSQEWKDKYIHNFVAVSTPWLGSVFALESYILGTNYGVPTFKKSLMKELVRTFQSVAFLLPAEEAFGETVLVDWTLKNKKYTAKNYRELFTDLQYEEGYLMREDVRSFFPVDIDKLGVKVVCIYSNLNKIETLQRYEIADDILNPKLVKSHFVEGDGTVTLNSLQHCDKFKNVTVKVFKGDIKYEDGFLMREDVRSLMPVAGDKLGVDVVCIWSKSVKTKFKMIVKGDIADPKSVSYETVDGDGTVNLDSLRYCETFPNVTTQEFTGLDHLKIVYSKDLINYLQSVLVNAKPL